MARSSSHWFLLIVSPLIAGACVQILGGERDVVGEDQACSDDSECSGSKVCESERCRKRCTEDSDCGAFRECVDRGCTEPVGTPCDAEEVLEDYCNGFSISCVDENADRDKVLGYCTVSCSTSDPSPICPTDYRCVNSRCLVED